jgi:hypothetical protein
MSNELRATLLREVHRLIDDAADGTVQKIAKIAHGDADARTASLAYPPTDGKSDAVGLTDAEVTALSQLARSEAAMSGLRKLLRETASASLFHFFCLLDGVGDPEGWEGDVWLGADLVAPREDMHREMLHDEFYDRYWEYIQRRAR